jgi:hypothetical protein
MIMLLLIPLLAVMSPSSAFTTPQNASPTRTRPSLSPGQPLFSSWDNFSYDDDDELLEVGPDEGFVAADENDDPEVKAAAGAALDAPDVSSFVVLQTNADWLCKCISYLFVLYGLTVLIFLTRLIIMDQ